VQDEQPKIERPPGTCIPWQEQRQKWPAFTGDERLVEQVWQDVDALGYMYIWQILVSF